MICITKRIKKKAKEKKEETKELFSLLRKTQADVTRRIYLYDPSTTEFFYSPSFLSNILVHFLRITIYVYYKKGTQTIVLKVDHVTLLAAS